MRTYRVVVSGPIPKSGKIQLTGPSFNHLIRVQRRTQGDSVELVFKELAISYVAIVDSITKDQATLTLQHQISNLSNAKITLICGMCKPKTIDFIASKSVELGISKICFFRASRSQGSLSPEQAKERVKRIERVIDSALKQSGNQSFPVSCKIFTDLQQTLQNLHKKKDTQSNNHLLLFQTPKREEESPISILDYFNKLSTQESTLSSKNDTSDLQLEGKYAESFLVIGPEGGLTEFEENLAIKGFGYTPISLGVKTLRVETAVIAAGTITSLALSS